MARFSRDQRRRSSPSTSPWMTMFYICALVFAPMLFMSMIPSAHAQEDAKDTSITGPGMLREILPPLNAPDSRANKTTQSSVLISEPPTLALVS